MDLIELKDIRKTYHLGEVDVPVLKGISMTIGRGEMVTRGLRGIWTATAMTPTARTAVARTPLMSRLSRTRGRKAPGQPTNL